MRQRGFTLIEILVVVMILGLLISLAAPRIIGRTDDARITKARADIKALELWIEEKKKDVRLWSSRTEIRQAVNDLARIAETEREPRGKLLSAPALASLRDVLEKFDRIAGRPERDGSPSARARAREPRSSRS